MNTLITLALTLAVSHGGHAQVTDPPPTPPDADLEIHLVTFGPGFRMWEHFGHNALWVRQPSRGIDLLYNYGIFNLQSEGFVREFIRGRMLYMMQPQSPRTIEAYLREHRSVWVQTLNLSTAQRVELRDFLGINALPENRDYLYHYYYDNCSTRIRDAIDMVLDGQLREQTFDVMSGVSFRFETQRLTYRDIPLYTGLMIGLANPVDREMTVWEQMFLPLAVRTRLRDVTVLDSTGARVPLIVSERTINEDHRYDGLPAPPKWLLWYLAAGLILAVPLWWLSRDGGTVRTWGFVVYGTGWALINGMAGTVLALLWIATNHTTSYGNENLFFLNPVALVLAVGLPLRAAGVRVARTVTLVTARGLIGVTVVGFLIQVLPGFDQVNGQVIALIAPPTVALCVGVLRRFGSEPSAG